MSLPQISPDTLLHVRTVGGGRAVPAAAESSASVRIASFTPPPPPSHHPLPCSFSKGTRRRQQSAAVAQVGSISYALCVRNSAALPPQSHCFPPQWKEHAQRGSSSEEMSVQICDFSGPGRLTWFTTSILAAHSLLMIRGSEGRREGGDSPATARGGRGEEGGRELGEKSRLRHDVLRREWGWGGRGDES